MTMVSYAMVTRKIQLSQPLSTSARGNLPEIISKLAGISEGHCSSWIFSNTLDVAEIISEAEAIVFQYQTWLHVKENTEIISFHM